MVQDQLVDYISSQMKLGISRDAIKAALTGAGWQPTDIEDTLKKVESGKTVAQPVASSVSSSKPAVMTTSVSSTTVTSSKTEPQSIKVSDLVSAPDSSAAFFSSSSAGSKNVSAKNSSMNTASEYPPKKHGGSMIMMIVCIIIILALAGFAAYLYSQNGSLSSKVASLSNTSSDISSKISSLNSQVDAMNASNTALMAQVASITATNQDLQTNLSFVAAPEGTTSSTPTSTVTLSGILSGGGKAPYTLMTAYGVKATVANSKDANVIAALGPIVTSTSTPTPTTELTGNHMPGSPDMTVTAVNGSPL